jgi:glutathione peroxidase
MRAYQPALRAVARRRVAVLPGALRRMGPHTLLRSFSSRYTGEMSDVLRFDCVFPAQTTLVPRAFRGRPVLVVNTASQCANAPQLRGLQQLHERFHSRGLTIVAVPSNDFNHHEPGSNEELTMVYTARDGAFQVAFPIAEKSAVVGEHAHAFFDRVAMKYGRSVAPTYVLSGWNVLVFEELTVFFFLLEMEFRQILGGCAW